MSTPAGSVFPCVVPDMNDDDGEDSFSQNPGSQVSTQLLTPLTQGSQSTQHTLNLFSDPASEAASQSEPFSPNLVREPSAGAFAEPAGQQRQFPIQAGIAAGVSFGHLADHVVPGTEQRAGMPKDDAHSRRVPSLSRRGTV